MNTKEFNEGVKLAKDGHALPHDAHAAVQEGYESVKGKGQHGHGKHGEPTPNPSREGNRTADAQRQYDEGVALARSGGPLPLNASDDTAAGYNTIYPRSGKPAPVPYSAEYNAGTKLAAEGKPLPAGANEETARGYHSASERNRGLRLDRPSHLQHLAGAKARTPKLPGNVSRGDPPPLEKEGADALGDNLDAQREYDAGVNLAKQQQNLSRDATENMRRGYAAVEQPGKPGFAPPQGDPNEIIMDVLSVKEVEAADGQPGHVEITEAGGGRLILAQKGDVEVLPPLQETPKQHRVKLKRDKFVYA